MKQTKLEKMVNDGLSSYEIAKQVGKSQTAIRYWLKKYGLSTMPSKRRRKSRIWTVPKTELKQLVKKSKSFADVIRGLGYTINKPSHLYKTLKQRLKEEEIDCSHIKSCTGGWNKGKKNMPWQYTKEEYEEKLKTQRILHQNDKKRIAELNIIPSDLCSICGQGRIWNGQKLVLQLDHIDGNPENNFPQNLRFVCPNCHTQTKTFSGKNISRISER